MERPRIVSRWQALQAEAHRPEVREVIRREIARHTIRVVPGPDGGIRIIPCAGPDDRPRPAGSPVRSGPERAPSSGPALLT
jgi:hypothetical protein